MKGILIPTSQKSAANWHFGPRCNLYPACSEDACRRTRAVPVSEPGRSLKVAKPEGVEVPHTYLAALGLRHLPPEDHAAGRVLNSHKRRRKTCSHLSEKWREWGNSARLLPGFLPPCSTIQQFPRSHSQTAVLFGNSHTAGRRKSTAGPKCIAAGTATKCEGVRGAKVCSPPARFPGEHCASRAEVDVGREKKNATRFAVTRRAGNLRGLRH